MSDEKKTGCECPLAGFCNRHQMNKTEHYHKLCQGHPGYFKMWEECRGPGQEFTDCKGGLTEETAPKPLQRKLTHAEMLERAKRDIPTSQKPPEGKAVEPKKGCSSCNKKKAQDTKKPGLFEQAGNFLGAAAKHIKNGMKKVTPEELEARLEICRNCPFYEARSTRCKKCGCFTGVKASWDSEKCPDGRW